MSEMYYNSADTICAVSTAPGVGGIAVVRLAGPQAFEIAAKIWRGKALDSVASHTAHLGTVVASDGTPLDQGVATVFRAPASYTGDDTVEFSVHGSRWIQQELLRSLTAAGARLALPGEFTRRAYSSGHLDLAQAEAVADLIAASGRAAHRAALSQLRGGISKRLEELRAKLLNFASLLELELDFSDQEVEFVPRDQLLALAAEIDSELSRLTASFSAGAAIKEGFPIVIMGAVNAGKSALLNALLDDDRAIVSDIPGTTRDIVEDRCQVGDYTVRFLDTAGFRATTDTIENLGIERTRKAANSAALVLYVVDATDPQPEEAIAAETAHLRPQNIIRVVNKIDLAPATTLPGVHVSALQGINIDGLLETIRHNLGRLAADTDDVVITSARHAEALANALESNRRTIAALQAGLPEDLVAQDLRETLHHLASITGTIATPEILTRIFSTFCIGK